MVLKRYFLAFIGLFFCLLSQAAQREWSAEDVPIPYLTDSTQYVSDPDGYVDKALRDSANFYLSRLKWQCGVQNVLIIVGKVAGQDAFRMAQDVGNKYGVGSKKTRRGLVIVIAVEDRKYFIAPGSGLEGELTDVDCDDIARACIVKYMREGHPGEAVASVSRAIYNKVKNGRTGIEDVDEGTVDEEDWILIVFLLLLFFGIPLYYLVRYVLEQLGWIKPRPKGNGRGQSRRRNHDDDWFPPFFMGGGGFSSGGSSGGGFSGGSFGGGSFSGGGSGGSW